MKPPTAYFSAGTTMEGVKEFLESSTIHGLVYIATTRRLARLLWILIVAAGSVGAVILIQQSFSSWASSPITTTIDTRPITDLDFPNVTVCPPRNSFTTLIPDLLRARNINLEVEKRKEQTGPLSLVEVPWDHDVADASSLILMLWTRSISSRSRIIYGIRDLASATYKKRTSSRA